MKEDDSESPFGLDGHPIFVPYGNQVQNDVHEQVREGKTIFQLPASLLRLDG